MSSFDTLRAAIRAMDGKIVAFESATLLSIIAELRRGDVSDQRLRTLRRPGSMAASASTRSTMVPTAKAGRYTAVIPAHGVAVYDVDFQPYCFSTLALSRTVAAAAADPTVENIAIDIDSPGGYVTGTQEAADAVYAARKKKAVVALVNPLAASAAYWIASQAETIIGVPSADVGSIGVFMTHYDLSEAFAEAGIRPTFIYAGKHKVEGNSMQPLAAEAKAFYQTQVDATYSDFTKAVARGRSTSVQTVLQNFGKGRCYDAQTALKLGMIDAIAPIDAAMQRVVSGTLPGRNAPSAAAGYRAQLAAHAATSPLPGDRYRAVIEMERQR
jgi:signal peptide peptidase SppA